MIVQTRTGKRGTVVDITPPDTPPESRRVYVRLELTLPGQPNGGRSVRPPARARDRRLRARRCRGGQGATDRLETMNERNPHARPETSL
jgi:hypothetical protein